MIYKDKLKFDAATITSSEYEFLSNFAKNNSLKNILEFGTGASTYSFLEVGCHVTTFETSRKYIPRMFPELLTLKECSVIYYNLDSLKSIILKQRFDLAFIDGPFGKPHLSRIESCLFSITYTDHLLLHDFKRTGERETLNFIVNKFPSWKFIQIETSRKMGYLYNFAKVNPLIPVS